MTHEPLLSQEVAVAHQASTHKGTRRIAPTAPLHKQSVLQAVHQSPTVNSQFMTGNTLSQRRMSGGLYQGFRQGKPGDNRIWNPPNLNDLLRQNPNLHNTIRNKQGIPDATVTHDIVDVNNDICLVVKGVPIDVNDTELIQFLEWNNISVRECTLLTRYEKAQSLTYRLLVRGGDHRRLTTPGFWMPGISVEPFRKKKRNAVKDRLSVPERSKRDTLPQQQKQTVRGYENFTVEIENERNIWLKKPNISA